MKMLKYLAVVLLWTLQLPVFAQETLKDTALLLIDIQYFYFPGGDAELVDPEQTSQKAAQLLEYFRTYSQPIVHIRHNYEPGGEIHRSVKPRAGELVISKDHANSFRDTDLFVHLATHNVGTLVIAGMQTHMCVEATTRAAADYGFSCIVISDACTTRDLHYGEYTVKAGDVHNSTLATLKSGYATIMTTREFLDMISKNYN